MNIDEDFMAWQKSIKSFRNAYQDNKVTGFLEPDYCAKKKEGGNLESPQKRPSKDDQFPKSSNEE